MNQRVAWLTVAGALCGLCGWAQAGRTLRADRVDNGSIQIDGVASDPGWQGLRAFEGFTQQDPDEGVPSTELTLVKIAYDDSAVYVWVDARDSKPAEIGGWLTRRDESSASDWIHVWLDTHDDDRTAYRFSVNPANVKQDARLMDAQEDVNWNGVWEVRTRRSKRGWTAEFRIPFPGLRYDSHHPRWGFQVRRDLRRLHETSYLSSTPRGATQLVPHFGTLRGLNALPSTWGFTLEPYVLGGIRRTDGTAASTADAGGELRIGLASQLNLIVTVNPDFGQFEADPSVLNLNATEVFLDERRTFFLDGGEHFEFPLDSGSLASNTLFYSRRIGRTPIGSGGLMAGEYITRYPSATPILAATKLTGKTNSGWSIGILDAITGDAVADVKADGSEESSERLVQPMANAAVVRIAKDYRSGQTTVGMMATHLANRLSGDATGEIENEFLADAASVGADATHRVGDYQFVAKAIGTVLEGSAAAIDAQQRSPVHYFQRPNADHVEADPARTSLAGYGLKLDAGKMSGSDWRAAAGVSLWSPGVDPNPLGFLERADQQSGWVWGQLRDDAPGFAHRRYDLNLNGYATQTYGSELTEAGGNFAASWMFPNQYELYMGLGRDVEHLDVTALRGGPGLLLPGRWYGWVGFGSDEAQSLVYSVDARWEDGPVNHEYRLSATAKYRPTPAVELSLSPLIAAGSNDAQFVDQVGGQTGADYVVGHLERQTASLTARANWTMSPQISLQIYASPFISAGTFTDFRAVVDPEAPAYADRFMPTAYDGGDKFRFAELRSNVVFRWEYRLGSTFFLIWSHDQTVSGEDTGAIRVGDDLDTLIHGPANDTVMLKLNHWLSL